MADRKTIRCAIYTRKSSEYGLEQDFNSLDAQREACEAYIKSQAHEGWKLVPTHYADGGISGATLERPAIQKLLTDVGDGKVDVIVVYKVDRLTRSLADFAKLVELFDAHNASFVSITQQFNTTNSMGRLTLNVLLSFAQFEREVTAERIRDKIAASKKKGLWLGGVIPLGYVVKDKKLAIDEKEAGQIRYIFERYLELPTIKALAQDLRGKCFATRIRTLSNGKTIGGVPFLEGPLAVILRNRVYVGDVTHAGNIYQGQHQPVIDRELFEAVQAKLAANADKKKAAYTKSDAILTGHIFDDAGGRMVPVHTRKGAMRYRYYVSATVCHEEPGAPGSVSRIPAASAEEAVVAAVRDQLTVQGTQSGDPVPPGRQGPAQEIIERYVERVVVTKHGLTITLKAQAIAHSDTSDDTINVPLYVRGRTAHHQIIPNHPDPASRRKTLKTERRFTLLMNIAKARRWAEELTTGRVVDTNELADREGCSERHVRQALSLAFLAPNIVQAAIDGELPPDLVMTRIRSNLPLSWSEQRKALALN